MESIDLSLIKPMLMRSLENPEAIKVFVNNIILWWFMGTPIVIIMTTIIVSFLYKTIHDTIKWWNDKNKEDKKEVKSSTKFWKICFNNLKYYLQKYRYFFIWWILLALCRMIVSLLYRCISLQMTWVNIPMDKFTSKEIMVLNHRIAYVLLFFIIAPIFIMVSFGNKFVRNIWIFIYILWILFILLWDFIQLGYMWM
jgi:hypothetical protein